MGGCRSFWSKRVCARICKYFIDCHVAFLRIDFLSWYEDGMDKGKQIDRNHGSANYRKVLEWIKEAAGDQIMISLVMPHLKNNGENEFGMGQMARINEDSGTGGWDTLVIETEDCILIIGLSARQHLKADLLGQILLTTT